MKLPTQFSSVFGAAFLLLHGSSAQQQLAPSQCNTKCNTIANPVCTNLGVWFQNVCLLDKARCNGHPVNIAFSSASCEVDCNALEFCTMEYKPLCGSDGITYANTCIFQHSHCRDNSLAVVHYGRCECQKQCPNKYEPVCGTNGQTYSSQCELRRVACEIPNEPLRVAHEGECALIGSSTTPSMAETHIFEESAIGFVGVEDPGMANQAGCDEACTSEYKPICGSDGMTYVNKCFLKITRCAGVNVEADHEGECGGPLPTPIPSSSLSPPPTSVGPTPGPAVVITPPPSRNDQGNGGAACFKFCTAEFNPVCGSDGTTYPNPCELEIAQCSNEDISFAHEGPCDDEADPTLTPTSTPSPSSEVPREGTYWTEFLQPCSFDCPTIEHKVCTENGREFRNHCEYIREICNDRALSMVSRVPCEGNGQPHSILFN